MTSVRKCLVLFLFTFWSIEAQNTLQWFSDEHNCSFAGRDVDKVSRKKIEDCGRLCLETPKCSRFTWNGATCRLKGGNKNPSFPVKDTSCGYVTTEKLLQNDIDWQYVATTRWEFNCYFTGPTIDVRNVKGDYCGSECLNHDDCIGFAWTTYQGGSCWLKSRGHPIVAYTGSAEDVCGEISDRKASYGSPRASSTGWKRKSEVACDECNGIASHYRITRSDPFLRMEFPWMAAVGHKSDGRIVFRCSGTIVSDFHVLVAAHCLDPVPQIVRFGTHILNDVKKIDIEIESIKKHPQFTSFEMHRNDIALIKLKQRVTFSHRILPACLRVKTNDLPLNQDLFVTGWEMTEEGKLSNVLKKKRLRTVDLDECKADYLKNGSKHSNQIEDNQYCVADPTNDDCPCPGDSGAPIQAFERWQPLATVVGIASFRKSAELPYVYTRVASFLEWIEHEIWSD